MILKRSATKEKAHVYLSIPMQVEWNRVVKVMDILDLAGISTSYWNRGSHYSEEGFNGVLTTVDAFIVMPPSNEFKLPLTKMTAGSRKELSIASNKNIPLYTVYYPSSSVNKTDPKIYAANIDSEASTNRTFTGIAGTYINAIDDIAAIGEERQKKELSKGLKISDEPGNQLMSADDWLNQYAVGVDPYKIHPSDTDSWKRNLEKQRKFAKYYGMQKEKEDAGWLKRFEEEFFAAASRKDFPKVKGIMEQLRDSHIYKYPMPPQDCFKIPDKRILLLLH